MPCPVGQRIAAALAFGAAAFQAGAFVFAVAFAVLLFLVHPACPERRRREGPWFWPERSLFVSRGWQDRDSWRPRSLSPRTPRSNKECQLDPIKHPAVESAAVTRGSKSAIEAAMNSTIKFVSTKWIYPLTAFALLAASACNSGPSVKTTEEKPAAAKAGALIGAKHHRSWP